MRCRLAVMSFPLQATGFHFASVALIGPTVNLTARLLKRVAPGGIIAPQIVVERLQEDAPTLHVPFACREPA